MNCCKAEPAIDDRSADSRLLDRETVLDGEIEFRHLNFSYGDDAGAARYLAADSGGLEPGHRGPDGLGQIDAGRT